jgi:hypothetical protein
MREFLIKCYSIIQHCMLSEYPLLYEDLLRSVLPVLACQQKQKFSAGYTDWHMSIITFLLHIKLQNLEIIQLLN